MNKSELRLLYRQRRRDLPAADLQAHSEAICRTFFEWFREQALQAPVVHTFLPIQKQKEINTWPIVRTLWQDFPSVRVAASVTSHTDGTLAHYQIFPDTPFVHNAYGIPEPAERSSVLMAASSIDLVLVPLLAFDRKGQRVGYGGGYYDRFLAQCRPDCLKIGLSLFEPVDLIEDIYEGDIPLNGCITPNEFYSFTKK